MQSQAFRQWRTVARAQLNEVAQAHFADDGNRRRFAVQQLNRAYLLLLASHLQGYCRDLHTECVGHLVRAINPPIQLEAFVQAEFTRNRQLDRGNAQPDSLRDDFRRLGLILWPALATADKRADGWRVELAELNQWRNAIAHHDFDQSRLGGTVKLERRRVRRWRSTLNRLARLMDRVVRDHLHRLLGVQPW